MNREDIERYFRAHPMREGQMYRVIGETIVEFVRRDGELVPKEVTDDEA